jgi:hypothetical protein
LLRGCSDDKKPKLQASSIGGGRRFSLSRESEGSVRAKKIEYIFEIKKPKLQASSIA